MCSIATCLILATLGVADGAQSARIAYSRKNLTSPIADGNVQLQIGATSSTQSSRTGVSFSARPEPQSELTTTAFTTSSRRRPNHRRFRRALSMCLVTRHAVQARMPARVVELRGGKIRLLAEVPDFPISAKRVKLASTLRRTATRNT